MGGWLTENGSWQWCFFINIPVAIGLISLLLIGVPHQKASIHELVEADWPGIIGMSIGLSCLTIVLEEGQRDQWFDSNVIRWLSVFAVLGLTTLVITQFTSKRPVLKLRLLNNRTYASVILIIMTVGMVLYDILYVLPQFLSGVAGYNAFQSGRILALSGLPAFALMPVLPRILRFGNIKLVVGFGLVCFAASCFIDIHLTAQSSGSDFIASQLLRGVGQIFSFMPLNQISVGAVSRTDTADAAGLFNMARNLGGTIGLALLGVFIDRRTEGHADVIRESLNANSVLVQDRIAQQGAVFAAQSGDTLYGQQQALASIAGQVHQQAVVMTFSDCFWILGVGLLVMMPLLFLLRAPKPAGPAQPVTEAH
jgi:DHA2 family multidrug resistance protein